MFLLSLVLVADDSFSRSHFQTSPKKCHRTYNPLDSVAEQLVALSHAFDSEFYKTCFISKNFVHVY